MRWRLKQMDNLKCGYCGGPNTTLRVGCDECNGERNKNMIYHRHFMKDFR